jgi:hypothetical protein
MRELSRLAARVTRATLSDLLFSEDLKPEAMRSSLLS